MYWKTVSSSFRITERPDADIVELIKERVVTHGTRRMSWWSGHRGMICNTPHDTVANDLSKWYYTISLLKVETFSKNITEYDAKGNITLEFMSYLFLPASLNLYKLVQVNSLCSCKEEGLQPGILKVILTGS